VDPRWLNWTKRLQAIAQTGLTYTNDIYDVERYESVRDIAAEVIDTYTDADLREIRALLMGETGHATPKVAVLGVVFREDRLLLVRQRGEGAWSLPGGWADVGESPAEAVVREVREESGFRTEARKLLAVYDRDRHGLTPLPFHVYTIFVSCDVVGGEATTSVETDAVEFFAEDALPSLSVARVTPKQVARLFEHHRHPGRPTDFD
jgi:ADP-ribose pyrophosphatase YjhB (NUDIX family)